MKEFDFSSICLIILKSIIMNRKERSLEITFTRLTEINITRISALVALSQTRKSRFTIIEIFPKYYGL